MLRRRRPLLAIALTIALAAAAPPSALAQQPPTIRSQLTGEALAAWDRGMNALNASQWATALPEFKHAYDLSKNPRVLINVGVCEKNLSNYVAAEKTWKQEITEGGDKLSGGEKQTLEQYITTVHQFTTTMTVKANVAGATLSIDGEPVGQTPFLEAVEVNVGAGHVVTLHKDGYKDQTVTKEFVTGVPASVEFTLLPVVMKSEASISVVGPPNAEIFVDGTDLGPAPFHGQIVAGRHTFEARASGYASTRQTSEVVYQQPFTLVLTLNPERHEGRVTIDAAPAGATISIDGKVVGASHWEGTLPSGGHQVIVTKPGYQTYSSELALRDDQVRTVQATLDEEKSRTWIWWTVGTLAVIGGGAVASYFIFKPADQQPVQGTMQPGLATGSFHFGR